MRFLQREDIPRWYRLSFDLQAMALKIIVHANLFKKLSISYIKTGEFGIESGWKNPHTWATINFRLSSATKETCQACNGKPDLFPGGHCFFCESKGWSFKPNFSIEEAMCMDISSVLKLLAFPKTEAPTKDLQLMTVSTSASLNVMESFPVNGVISSFCANLLNDCNANETVAIMQKVFQNMTGEFSEKFKCRIEDGLLDLTCPGNAVGISPISYTSNVAYEFQSHNMSSPYQQLCILCGLANLQDQIKRKE